MDELAAAIVPDAALFQLIGEVSEHSGGDTLNFDIGRFSLHMEALSCNSSATAAHKNISQFATERRDYANLSFAEVIFNGIYDFYEIGVDGMSLIGQAASEEVSDIVEHFRIVIPLLVTIAKSFSVLFDWTKEGKHPVAAHARCNRWSIESASRHRVS